MNQQLEALIEKAYTMVTHTRADGSTFEYYGFGRGQVNGHDVYVCVVEQCRRTTSRRKQRPSLMFKVDGKRVSKANLAAALA